MPNWATCPNGKVAQLGKLPKWKVAQLGNLPKWKIAHLGNLPKWESCLIGKIVTDCYIHFFLSWPWYEHHNNKNKTKISISISINNINNNSITSRTRIDIVHVQWLVINLQNWWKYILKITYKISENMSLFLQIGPFRTDEHVYNTLCSL